MSQRTKLIAVVGLVALVAVAGCMGGGGGGDSAGGFDGDAAMGDGADGMGNGDAARANDDLGYAAGGANDVTNFRENVEEGYVPQPTDLTYEGLFGEYYFDAGSVECEQLFCPAYESAVTRDPLSDETERYLTVGLESNLNASTFERKPLDLVVVLDVSGSMSQQFGGYYYDENGERQETERRRKMAAARDAVHGLTEHLEGDDRFGLVTYENSAQTEVRMRRMSEHDHDEVNSTIESLRAGGGTNLDAGMSEAREMLGEYADANRTDRETRVIYVTDAMPNLGDTSAGGLKGELERDADRRIHSTFVGVGVDFNSRLVEAFSDVRGANYYTVESAAQFQQRMDEEFEYMVTPMVHDLELRLESEGYDIRKVYGSPSADRSTGELMHVTTLFPSPTQNGSTKGGVVLLQLERTGEADGLELTASYENRAGEAHESTRTITFADRDPEHFQSDAIRKAVLLSREGSLLKNWAAHERARANGDDPTEPDEGIEPRGQRSQWEQGSVALRLSPTYRDRIDRFADHLRGEVEAIGDDDLHQEVDMLERILEAESESER